MGSTPIHSDAERVGAIEEYKSLQSQIQRYSLQRTAILSVVLAAVAALLAFGTASNLIAATLALNAVLLGGGALTWNSHYQVCRRAAYIAVVLEPMIPGLRWYSCLREEGSRDFCLMFRRKTVRINSLWVPHDYPTIYFLLGSACSVYVIMLAFQQGSVAALVIATIGYLVLVPLVIVIQIANSGWGFERFVKHWSKLCSEVAIERE